MRRFLPPEPRFRRARAAFNGSPEHREMPQRRNGAQVLAEGRERADFLRNGGVEDGDMDPVKRHRVKRASIFYALPTGRFYSFSFASCGGFFLSRNSFFALYNVYSSMVQVLLFTSTLQMDRALSRLEAYKYSGKWLLSRIRSLWLIFLYII